MISANVKGKKKLIFSGKDKLGIGQVGWFKKGFVVGPDLQE
jgi:hypothetical protein